MVYDFCSQEYVDKMCLQAMLKQYVGTHDRQCVTHMSTSMLLETDASEGQASCVLLL